MHPSALPLILFSVTLTAFAQLLLKLGMSTGAVQRAMGHGLVDTLLASVNPWVAGGLALYVASTVLWLLALARAELSFAYPFMGLTLVLTLLLSAWLLGEAVGPLRLAGTLLIALGLVLVTR